MGNKGEITGGPCALRYLVAMLMFLDHFSAPEHPVGAATGTHHVAESRRIQFESSTVLKSVILFYGTILPDMP